MMANKDNLDITQINSQVTQTFETLAEAAKALDSIGYFSLFDKERFTSLNHDGTVIQDFAEFERIYEDQTSSIENYLSLEFANVKITIPTPNIAVLVNEYSAKLKLKSGETIHAEGAGTQVWCNTNGRWLLIHIASSSGN